MANNYFSIFEDPASGPKIVSINATSSKSIEVSWSKLADVDSNGNITHYLVCYKVQASTDDICFKTKRVNGDSERNTILTDLNVYTTYNIAIKAATSVGAGPHGGIMSETTCEDGKYKNVVSKNDI